MQIIYRAVYMSHAVDFALETLQSLSPVGSAPEDEHPGLYRDSHMVFIDGKVVKDASAWQPGQTVHISNPVPYSRKIETESMKMSVPGHVYERAEPIVKGRFGNSVSVKFVFMPVRFAGTAAWASFTKMQRTGRKLSDKARRDWLVRQPALMMTAR